ncbi:MAG: hypothetical protein KUG69_12415 [Marinosulfonomonas sp.]|nr:hypothetical protein [Marinosulfonomonas sp.]
MSIWTCNSRHWRRLAVGTTLLMLAGCLAGPDVGMGVGGFGLHARVPEKILVANHSVIIAGPPGFCVDRSATHDTGIGAFVLLGSCASIANNPGAATPNVPGLLTASVSGESGATVGSKPNRLRAFFSSPAGRAALARNGDAASVKILDTRYRDGAFFIHARDTGAGRTKGLATDYWRGLFDVKGRIVTVTLNEFKGKPMSDAAGLATLNAFATRIRLENLSQAPLAPKT